MGLALNNIKRVDMPLNKETINHKKNHQLKSGNQVESNFWKKLYDFNLFIISIIHKQFQSVQVNILTTKTFYEYIISINYT